MNKLVTNWTIVLVMSLIIVACNKDESAIDTTVDPPTTVPTATPQETIKLSLEADVEEVLRAITTDIHLKLNEQQIPIIDLDKMEKDIVHPITGKPAKGVDVNVAIRSNNNADPVTYVTVPFVRNGKKLCLASTDITLAPGTNFTNEGGRKWYIMGILGGSFKPEAGNQCVGTETNTTALGWTTSASGPANFSTGKLLVPMAMFPWTEIKIRKESAFTQGDAGHDLHFAMRGSLLRIRIKNDLQRSKGALHNFSGMELYSNAFSNNGYFLIRGELREGQYPEWRSVTRAGQTGTYSVPMINPRTGVQEQFAKIDVFSELAGKTIAHGDYIENVVWVMPRSVNTPATISKIGTMQMGTNPHRYFTTREDSPTNLSEYSTRVRNNIPEEGKVYTLTTDVKRPVLPLEFVAESNVGPTARSFAIDHFKENQGYYRGTPSSDPDLIQAFGPETNMAMEDVVPANHHVPTLEELNGIFSVGTRGTTDFSSNIHYAITSSPYVNSEVVATAGNTYSLPAHYKNVSSQSPLSTYALRFMGSGSGDDTLLQTAWRYIFYDNLRIDGKLYSNALVVFSRWIGDPDFGDQEAYSVDAISSPDWWSDAAPTKPRAYGPIVKRIFVATGKKEEKWNSGRPSELEWASLDYVKLNGAYDISTGTSPRAMFNNQKGATVSGQIREEHVPIRPFRNPALLGY